MYPILIQIGSVTLYSFGLLVAFAFLAGTFWAMKRAESAGESGDSYLQAVFWIVLSGFIGARLLYAAYFPGIYLEEPLKILTDRGGFVWYGGLISAIVVSLVYVKIKKISLARFGDIMIVPAALGLAIGRIGCFVSGCCYGKPTELPWGVQFPHYHETYPMFVHPTQLYESAALFLFTLILWKMEKRFRMPGQTTCLFFIGYGLIRFIIEYFRGDGVYWIGHLLTASQLFSLIGIAGGLLAMIFLARRSGYRLKPIA